MTITLKNNQNCHFQIHNDHGLKSRRLKDVDDEHWDLSVFTDNGLGRREGVDVCMCCVRTCVFVRENQ